MVALPAAASGDMALMGMVVKPAGSAPGGAAATKPAGTVPGNGAETVAKCTAKPAGVEPPIMAMAGFGICEPPATAEKAAAAPPAAPPVMDCQNSTPSWPEETWPAFAAERISGDAESIISRQSRKNRRPLKTRETGSSKRLPVKGRANRLERRRCAT